MKSPFNVDLMPPQASEFAAQYDQFFWYITTVVGCGGTLVYVLLTIFCFKFAKKRPGNLRERTDVTPRILGSFKFELVWTLIPLFFFLSIFTWGTKIYNSVTAIPEDAPEIFVVGKQWMWKIQHPDGQREINELHLAINTPVKVTVVSEDVIHDFGIPAFRSKIDAVPGRYVSTWYKPTLEGEFHIFCDQYCGQGHSQMVGKVYVLSKENFEKWKQGTYRREGKQNSVDGSAAWEGEKLFKKLQCITCHNSEGGQAAPNLFGLYGSTIPLSDGTKVVVDEAYIRESIRKPLAKVHEGWRPIMPAFTQSQLTESELLAVTQYIKSKTRNDSMPRRVDDGPNQIGAPVNDTPKTPPAPVPGGEKK
ncbi:MAG: cytochrome c oxidase subunit II [Gemmataceae bacterium]